VKDDAVARARARQAWPGQVTNLADASSSLAGVHTSPSERVAMVWRITIDSWVLSGRSWPSYDRAHMPGRVLRPTVPDVDDT
jgi:hypothetical protein